MKNEMDQALFEEIEAYLLKTMSEDARSGFEQRIRADKQLQDEVDAQRDNMLAVELGAFTGSLQDALRSYDADNPSIDPKAVGWFQKTRLLQIAAVVALLLLGTWWNLRPNLNERLYAEYHVTDPGLPVPMSASDDLVFHDAMVDFKMGKYEGAIRKWLPLLLEDPSNDVLQFYVASAHLELEHYNKAIKVFDTVAGNGTSAFKHKAEWFAFLARLHAGDMDEIYNYEASTDSKYLARIQEIKERLR